MRIDLMLRLCRIPRTITKGPRLQRRGGDLCFITGVPEGSLSPEPFPAAPLLLPRGAGAGAARCPPRDARERRRRRKRERGRFLCLCRAGPAAPGAAAAPTPAATPAARGGRHGRVREPAEEDAHQGTGWAGRAAAGPSAGSLRGVGSGREEGRSEPKMVVPSCGAGLGQCQAPAGPWGACAPRLQEGVGELSIADRGGVDWFGYRPCKETGRSHGRQIINH